MVSGTCKRPRMVRPLIAAIAVGLAAPSIAAESLHERIDQAVESASGGMQAATVDDAEFLRRIYLDLTGMAPTVEQTRAFLADPSPAKRAALVDRLLAGPHYARHLATTLDVLLMERRGHQHVSADEWQQYLLKSVQENKPWNQLAREILAADGVDPALRPAARFYLDRAAEPNLLTRDIGRIFLGRDMQCAQCHDHPLIDDYHQADYHGLFAFFSGGFAFTAPAPDGKTYYAERAGTNAQFESVFLKGTKHLAGPRALGGVEVVEPFFYPGEEYQVAPAEKVRPVPKFSRRAKLAEEVASGANRAFNENIANRLWAQMMGRGLVHPVDLHHSGNPPSHPQLLRMLGEEFARMNFEMKGFLRELALTRTYQRAIDLPANIVEQSAGSAALLGSLQQEQQALSAAAEQSQAAYAETLARWSAAEAAALPVFAEMEQARAKGAEAAKKASDAERALADAQAQLKSRQEIAQALSEAAAKAKDAAAKLPGETELAQAAQKFADRAAQIGAEIPPLTKAVEEKTAALPPLLADRDATRAAIDAAKAKLDPLDAALRQAEQAMIAARAKSIDDATVVARLEQRIERAEQLAGLKGLDEQIAQAEQAAAQHPAAIETAQKLLAEYAPVVAQRQNEVAGAEQQYAAATQALATVQQEHAKCQQIAKAVGDALTATQSAQQLATTDSALAEAAAKLKERFDQLQTELAEHQKQVDAAAAAQSAAAAQVAAAKKSLEEAVQEQSRRDEAVESAQQALQSAVAQVEAARAKRAEIMAILAADWTASFQVAPLKPLTPEQICWSILQVTGIYERYVQAELAELEKTAPLSEEAKADPAQVAARAAEADRRAYDKLKGNVAPFVSIYAAAAGQPQGDFFATADQALFAANGGTINSWVAPAGGNVTERITNEADTRKAAEDLYLTILTRHPTDQEIADLTAYFAARPQERAACAQELVWALLTSAEFRFNH